MRLVSPTIASLWVTRLPAPRPRAHNSWLPLVALCVHSRPGKFNYFLSSHQIWHVCVFAAVYVWYQNVMISKEIVDSDVCVQACLATM